MPESRYTPTGIQLAAGTLLADRYKIIKRIGGGGMGSVYLAEDQNLANRRVAVKEMIEMFADESSRVKAIEEFTRESELLARLDHPSIPAIYQYFFDTARGRYYLVMRYIDGGDLAWRQREMGGRVDEPTVTKWAIDICDALDYIHSQSPPIIYRDLKPANLMIDSRANRVMLVDFGIARFVAPTQKGVSAIGTMGYAPPELFAGNVEPRSDIYSLGATMFHLLTGNDPQDNPLLVFDFAKNPKPRQINPAITREMEEMICRAVEHFPKNRFASARELGQALRTHQRDFQKSNTPAGVPSGSASIQHSPNLKVEQQDAPTSAPPGSAGIQLAPGTLLVDRYKIVRHIGGGSRSSVYLAEDLNLANRRVCVKELLEMFADEAERAKAIEDFKRQAELLAFLDHPLIPTMYEYFFDTARSRYYIVMKYIDGETSAAVQRSRGGRVEELLVTQWAFQSCEILDYLHSQNPPVIFRDVKPANLMIDSRTKQIMLIGFSIARFVAPTQKGVTAIGTMGYAPPELFAGNVEPRSDIYSLGATMFHLLTGNDPQDNPLLVFDFAKNPKPRQINPMITPEMEEMICRAVEHKPPNRFASARAFGQELQTHLRYLQDGRRGVNRPVNQCVNCENELAPDDIFCNYCGTRQPQKRTIPKLILLIRGQGTAQFVINASGESLIGRMDPNRGIRPEVDLSKYDSYARVSRRHARIVAQGDQFLVEDLGSANGTFVNGTKVPHGTTIEIREGDALRIGEIELKFSLAGYAPVVSTAQPNEEVTPVGLATETRIDLKPDIIIELLPRLSKNARRALLWAEELRRAALADELLSEFLLSGFLLSDTFARDLLTMFYDEAYVTAILERDVNRITGRSVSFASIQVNPETEESLLATALSPNLDRILRRASTISESIHTRHLVAAILDVPESQAAQWITRLTGVGQQQLFELIITSPHQLPTLDQVYEISTDRSHYKLPYSSIPRAVILEDAEVNIPLRQALRQARAISTIHVDNNLPYAVIVFNKPGYDSDYWNYQNSRQVPVLIIVSEFESVPIDLANEPYVTFLDNPSTEQLWKFFEAKLHPASTATSEPVESQTIAYEITLATPAEQIPIGGEVEVSVALRPAGVEDVLGFLLEVPRAEAVGGKLNILLRAPRFKFEGRAEESLPFHPVAEQVVLFRLTALRAGKWTIKADLYLGKAFQGSLENEVEISGIGEIPAPPSQAARPRPVAQPDLALQVRTVWNEDDSAFRFHYSMSSFRAPLAPAPEGEYVSESFDAAWSDRMRRMLGVALQEIDGAEPEEARLRLAALGRHLHRKLWPNNLLNAFGQWARGCRTLLIVADDDAWPPWELLHDGRAFLGERFIVGRWPRELDEARPYEFPVGEINIAYYENVERPEAWEKLLIAAGTPDPVLLPGGMLSGLDQAETMRGLHIVRLGQPTGGQDRQEAPVIYGNGDGTDKVETKLRPVELSLRRYRPLVSLSYVSDGQPELTMLEQSWASAFVRARSSAFVGTLWAVRPAVDAAFTAGFYQRLWVGDSLGAAFQAGRSLARAVAPETMDSLAYILFGDPLARPYRPVAGQGYAVVEPIGRQMEDPLPPNTPARFLISLSRTPPVWHEERVVEVAENLAFDNPLARISAFGMKVSPASPITLKRTPAGDYLGWFTISAPADLAGDEALVQVYFADGTKPINSIYFPVNVAG